MSGHLPSGTHINPKFSGAHINPNFKGSNENSQQQKQIHINPRFLNKNEENAKMSSKVLINPKFANRALPPIPGSQSPKKSKAHINPEFLDGKKAKAYEESIKMAVEGKVHVKSNVSPTSAQEKENLRTPIQSHAKTPSVFTSATKSLFKKIGNRKLVRVKSNASNKSDPESTPKFRTSLTKIGSRKLIKGKAPSPVKNSRMNNNSSKRNSLNGIYRVKTNRKVVKKSPKFTTPFSSRKRKASNSISPAQRRKKFALSKVLNPFKVDRRSTSVNRKIMKRTVTPKKLGSGRQKSTAPPTVSPKPQKPSETPLMKKPAPPKPARRTPAPNQKPSTTLINVQGVRFAVSDNGRKLKRLQETQTSQEKNTSISQDVPKKLFLEGEEYIEEEPGILIRSRNSMTRQSITSYKQRSINTILKSQTRSKQYCMFFNKFGKCKKKEDGRCPYIHDPEKVAVCRKFLQGNCFKEHCLLSHKVAPEKMPVCKYFLEGLCSRDPCPYSHVKVNDAAEICPDFRKGFCPLYDKCMKRHEEDSKRSENSSKKVPPVKPKRKSIGATPVPNSDKKKARTRYFENESNEQDKPVPEENETKPSVSATFDESFEKKRQRLLKKVELAKQGWSGIGAVQDNDNEKPKNASFLDDSGPYEEIDDDYEEEARPPIGPLPSFISLTNNEAEGQDQENEEFEERLI